MIVVTGTQRAGTSLWMQILGAGGISIIGEAFPETWGEALREANPRGFYESKLAAGIYFHTNPDPGTSEYLFPEEVEDCGVKIFIPGLIRTELAFLGRVIVTIRPWRDYVASWRAFERLAEASGVQARALEVGPTTLHPALVWWSEHYALVRDVAIRRYPVHVQAYPALVEQPKQVLRRTFDWLGTGDAEAALRAVDPSLQRSGGSGDDVHAPTVSSRCLRTFDRLYEATRAGGSFDDGFIRELNECHEELRPFFLTHQLGLQRDLLRAVAE